MTTIPNPADLVSRMKDEVLRDVFIGTVPADVASFGDLHDYVDANCYGGVCEDDLFEALVTHFGGDLAEGGIPDAMTDYLNAAQDAVNAWIVSGELRAQVERVYAVKRPRQEARDAL